MSALNLFPDPYLLSGQLLLLGLHSLAVARLFARPYLALKDAQEALVEEPRRRAQQLQELQRHQLDQIHARLKLAREQALLYQRRVHDGAIQEQNAMIAKAREEARGVAQEAHRALSQQRGEAEAKLPGLIQELKEHFFRAM